MSRASRALRQPAAEPKPQTLRLETRGETSVLICTDDDDCHFPFATVESGKLIIKSKHYSSQHTNGLTLAHVMMIAVEMRRQLQRPEQW